MAGRRREEVLNTVLAACLSARGVKADPETILQQGRVRPDVIAISRGLRCALEGKLAGTAQAKARVSEDARKRIDQGVAHIAIGVVYPREMRSGDFSILSKEMSRARFEFLVLTESSEGVWGTGGVDDILAELRRAYEVIVQDDVLKQAVDTLSLGLSEVANALIGNKGTCDRLIKLLGVGGKSDAKVPL